MLTVTALFAGFIFGVVVTALLTSESQRIVTLEQENERLHAELYHLHERFRVM